MLDVFDSWNEVKKEIHDLATDKFIKEGDIWWCSVGINIGSEVLGKGERFRRPVLIIRKISKELAVVIPLSSKAKIGTWYCEIEVSGINRTALLYQVRTVSSKRFSARISTMTDKELKIVKEKLKHFLNI